MSKKLRKLIGLSLKSESENKVQTYADVGQKLIGIISHDGNHSSREETVQHIRTTEERYLYRELKKVLKTKKPVDVYEQLMLDLKEINLED
jgi:hypothetical protein